MTTLILEIWEHRIAKVHASCRRLVQCRLNRVGRRRQPPSIRHHVQYFVITRSRLNL